MTTPQVLITAELILVHVLFVWGKWHNDLGAIFA